VASVYKSLVTAIRRTNHRRFLAAAFAVFAVAVLAAHSGAGETAGSPRPGAVTALLPAMSGWTKDGEPQVYTPETLFEYIDGAADAYLSFDFEELAVLSYNGENKRSVTVEIYRHRDLPSAFGIYTQERPQNGNFIDIGTEGYYDTGILDFFQGPYYVKLTGFRLGEDDKDVLTAVARDIAKRVGAAPGFPKALACFPEEGRLAHSERYFARDVLGHGFLHSAYAADYETTGGVLRLYLFEGKDEADARRMLDDYFKLAGAPPAESVGGPEPRTYRFADPRRTASEGALFRASGRYFWGAFATESVAMPYIDRFESSLRTCGYIE
jgi:hypothetical protein